MSSNRIIVFDLDDTLYQEADFVSSGFMHIAACIRIPECHHQLIRWWQEGKDAFEELLNLYRLSIDKNDLLSIYRYQKPDISLTEDVRNVLKKLSASNTIGLITDGRKLTQWNKIKALGLTEYIEPDNIIISEEFGYPKPAIEPFKFFMDKYPNAYYCYVGDNLLKDFVAPNQLGWDSICLIDYGNNIFKQDFEQCPKSHLPRKTTTRFSEIINLIGDGEVVV